MEIRERILNAGRELARLQGFYNMSMDKLAAHAGVSKRTIYRYFRSKEGFIEAVLDEFMEQMAKEAEVARATISEPHLFFAHMSRNLFLRGQFLINNLVLDDLSKHYPHLWQKLDVFRTEQISHTITVLMERTDNRLIKEINPLIFSTMIVACIKAVLNPDFILENQLSFEECVQQMSKLFVAAFYPHEESPGE